MLKHRKGEIEMKKIIRSKLVRVLFLIIAITGGVLAYSAYRKHELTQFVMWSPRAKMMDYEFIDIKR